MHGLRKRQKKPGKREIRSISLKKQTEKNKKQKTGFTKEEKKRLKELRMIKAENQKKRKPFTAQDTIPYKEIYKDICNIREKIEDDPGQPMYIQTVRGVGYRFNGNLGSK